MLCWACSGGEPGLCFLFMQQGCASKSLMLRSENIHMKYDKNRNVKISLCWVNILCDSFLCELKSSHGQNDYPQRGTCFPCYDSHLLASGKKKKKNLVPTFRKKTLYLQCHLPEDGVWFDGEWLLTLCLQQELFNRNFH